MIINYKQNEIQIKIVYYGCAMSGKTTSLKKLFEGFPNSNKKLTSIETTTGRTLFFDFGILTLKGGEWKIKIALYTATGQDFYAATRPSTLTRSDGIIFIIDAQKQYWDDNLRSWEELRQYYGEKINKIPIIFCLNKQDLPDLINRDDFLEKFQINQEKKIDIVETTALDGYGITISFKKILQKIFPSIKIK